MPLWALGIPYNDRNRDSKSASFSSLLFLVRDLRSYSIPGSSFMCQNEEIFGSSSLLLLLTFFHFILFIFLFFFFSFWHE